jgi:hypothetical protein
MTKSNGNSKGIWEYLRIVTPVLTTLGLFIVALVGNGINTRIDRMETQVCTSIEKVDEKLFKHLTNEELHVVRSTIVDKAQFDLINQIRAAQIAEIKTDMSDIKLLLMQDRTNKINAKTK